MAPEMIIDPHTADTPADVWAIGAILYELISGNRPFGAGLQAVPRITSGEPPDIPSFVDKIEFKALGKELYELIVACLNKDAGKRPSADELVIKCQALCYQIHARQIGMVRGYVKKNYGFIKCAQSGDDVFFHVDSVYGPKPAEGSRECLVIIWVVEHDVLIQ